MLTLRLVELRTLPNELLVRHYSRCYTQLSLRDYDNANVVKITLVTHACSYSIMTFCSLLALYYSYM